MDESSKQNILFDIARGLAALVVMFGHLRQFMFVSVPQIENSSIIVKPFYFLTGFGHQAVMVFFVLSGYLISQSIITSYQRNRFSIIRYSISRLSRLWMVLIPCLILTYIFDSMGILFGDPGFYMGERVEVVSAPDVGVHDMGMQNFISNMFFLQTVTSSTYGSNGPLWSLANEFWYYVMFPLMFFIYTAKNYYIKIICVSALVACIYFLPIIILELGLVWLAGVVAFLARNMQWVKYTKYWLMRIFIVFMFFKSAVLYRTEVISDIEGELYLAITFALILLSCKEIVIRPAWLVKIITQISDQSYTLYLFHFPFFAFLIGVIYGAERVQPSLINIVLYVGFAGAALYLSYMIYYLFERNTPIVRKKIMSIFNM